MTTEDRRRRAATRYVTAALGESRAAIYELLNKHQEQRARELDAAIEALGKALPSTPVPDLLPPEAQ